VSLLQRHARFALLLAALGCGEDFVVGDEQNQATRPPRAWSAEPVKEGNLRVVTLNIRNYPAVEDEAAAPNERTSPSTDEGMLLDLLAELDFDVLAVEEVRDPARFEGLLAELAERTGSPGYTSAFAANTLSGNEQRVGIVVRSEKLALGDVVEHAEIDVKGTLRSGLSARVTSTRDGGADFGVLVLHLASGDSVKRATLRTEQAKAASSVVATAAASAGDQDFIVLGDLNTAREEQEYPALDEAFASAAALTRLDNEGACTSYYVKNKLGALHPSLLDQVYVSSLEELDQDVPLRAGAHCFERSCQPFESDGPDTGTTYWGVSDHCPVYFEIQDADAD
jgi:endonuclease/exonuclease/phosphatase family metal-dependent hydrolase